MWPFLSGLCRFPVVTDIETRLLLGGFAHESSIRFGHDSDPDCMIFDETLYGVSEKISNFGII